MMDWLKKRTPLGKGQKAAIADEPEVLEMVDSTQFYPNPEREPRQAWDDDAKEGVDYDVVTRSRTFSAQTRAQHMIEALLAAHEEVGSQPDVVSFSIEVGAVDDRGFADPTVRQHIFIEASMDGRRGR